MTTDDVDDNRLVAYEGPPLRYERDRLIYYGTSLVHLGARGTLTQFVPPQRADYNLQMREAFPELLPRMEADASFGAVVCWSIEWARCGMPRVDLGHKLAASLMATSMSPDVISDVVVPWPAFGILIPAGLLSVENAAGVAEDLTCAHALHDGGSVRLMASSAAATMSVWSGAVRKLPELGEPDGAAGKNPQFTATPFDHRDLRALQMIDRLFLGVCALLSAPDDAREIAKRFGQAKHRLRSSAFPEVWTYRLKRDVTFDARAVVRDYVVGGGRSPTVQSQVRGHWRRQHHGRDMSEVKWIQIEPYWRGPEDAPIAVRDHKIKT